MKKNNLLLMLCSIFLLFSCSKEDIELAKETNLLTQEQITKVELSKAASKIVAKISQNDEVRKEIFETIDVISKNPYRDEAFYFIEVLKNGHNFYLEKPSKFAELFYEELNLEIAINYRNVDQDFIDNLYANDLQVYFPYYEDFSEADIYTVSYQNIIDENENEGFYYDEDLEINELVSDEYALSKATLIVGSFDNSEQRCTSPFERCIDVVEPDDNGSDDGGTNPTGPSAQFPGLLEPLFVNIGKARLTQQYDGIFAGGSEIRWYATSSTLFGNSANATADVDFLNFFSRSDIKDKKWKNVNRIIEHAWYPWEVNCVIGVYEDDDNGLIDNITDLILPIQVDLPVIGVITLEAGKEMHNRDEDLGWTKYDRFQFWQTNRPNQNLGNGTENGWPVYNHGGGLKFTMPVIN